MINPVTCKKTGVVPAKQAFKDPACSGLFRGLLLGLALSVLGGCPLQLSKSDNSKPAVETNDMLADHISSKKDMTINYVNSYNSHGEENQPYRAPHNEVCYEVKKSKIECGNFKIVSAILSTKYRTVSVGADVMASFNVKTHPGNYPFLNRLAKKLGYIDSEKKLVSDWNYLDADTKSEIIERYSGIGNTPEMKDILANYLNSCINYWSDPNAKYDKRIELPTLAEVSALCIADSGVLPN